jgi:hypothetical protein
MNADAARWKVFDRVCRFNEFFGDWHALPSQVVREVTFCFASLAYRVKCFSLLSPVDERVLRLLLLKAIEDGKPLDEVQREFCFNLTRVCVPRAPPASFDDLDDGQHGEYDADLHIAADMLSNALQ